MIYYCYFIVTYYMSLVLKFQLNDKLQIKPIKRSWSTAPNIEYMLNTLIAYIHMSAKNVLTIFSKKKEHGENKTEHTDFQLPLPGNVRTQLHFLLYGLFDFDNKTTVYR